MNSNDIRSIVESKIREEESTSKLYNSLLATMSREQANVQINFCKGYLRLVPKLLDQVYAGVSQSGLLSRFQPIYNTIFTYWQESYDVIPDRLGIKGICDDAYMSLSLMQMVANTPAPGTNSALVPGLNDSLQQQNNVMSHLLGIDVTAQLNNIVLQTYHSVLVQQSINDIFNMMLGGMGNGIGANTLFGGNSLKAMNNALEMNRIDRMVDTQMGAMGIV